MMRLELGAGLFTLVALVGLAYAGLEPQVGLTNLKGDIALDDARLLKKVVGWRIKAMEGA